MLWVTTMRSPCVCMPVPPPLLVALAAALSLRFCLRLTLHTLTHLQPGPLGQWRMASLCRTSAS